MCVATSILLTACAHAPEPRIVTKEVLIPVRQACVPDDVPGAPSSYPDDNLPSAPELAAERYRLTAAANERRRARLSVLEPVVASCR